MTETLSPDPLASEIRIMREWIERDVIEAGTCPPLSKLTQHYRASDRTIDWDEFGQEVVLVSYTSFSPSDPELLARATAEYIDFITRSTREADTPYTKVFILPDFSSNTGYDAFIKAMVNNAVESFTFDPTKRGIVRRAFKQILATQPEEQIRGQALLDEVEIDNTRFLLADTVVQQGYRPVFFYGKQLSGNELEELGTDRGDSRRYQVLSRAPYYAFQLVNRRRAPNLVGNLDRQKVHARNTEYAVGQLPGYQQTLRNYRTKR